MLLSQFLKVSLTGSLTAFALISSFPVSAIEAIPESCLACKGIQQDGEFVMCLYDCLGSVKLEGYRSPATQSDQSVTPPSAKEGELSDNETAGPTVGGWSTKEIRKADGTSGRIAQITSTDSFPFFFERVRPTLLVMKDQGEDPLIVVDVRPGSVTGFSDRLLVQIDEEKIRQYRINSIWNGHAVILKDQKLIKAIRSGKVFTMRLEVFGAGTQTFSFSLKGSSKILRWLENDAGIRS